NQLRGELAGDDQIAIERTAGPRGDVGTVVDEALIGNLPAAPIACRISRRNGPLPIRHGARRVGDVLHVAIARRRQIERQHTVRLQIELRWRRRWRPRRVHLPGVRARLERRRLPWKLLAGAVEPVTEPRRLDLLAELDGRIVSAKWNLADRRRRRVVPLAMEPRPGDDDVEAIRIADLGSAVDLPGSPRI